MFIMEYRKWDFTGPPLGVRVSPHPELGLSRQEYQFVWMSR